MRLRKGVAIQPRSDGSGGHLVYDLMLHAELRAALMWVSVEHTHRKVAYLQEHARLLGQLPLGARNREPRRPGGVATRALPKRTK